MPSDALKISVLGGLLRGALGAHLNGDYMSFSQQTAHVEWE